jgi:UDP-N-acetylmuramate--alanine ligase
VFERYRIIHFVGIGGIGMSGIAEVLHNLGYEVTGSDRKESETTSRLRNLGIKVYIGHRAEHVDDAHVLVISSAVSPENPEVIEARKKSVPVIPRAEMLAELARLKYGVLVAGAHGKTTTTSLISAVFARAGLDPTIVIGGRLKATGANARLGQGAFLVAEADESDGSFLKLSPTIAVVTNIDREHMDFFKTIEALKEAFLSFINKVPFYGTAVVCIENEQLRELLPSVHRRYLTYGLTPKAHLYADTIQRGFLSVSFNAIYKGKNLGTFDLPAPGTHNLLNCLAAIGVALILKIDVQTIKDALREFSGIQRRLELKGEAEGVLVFDDYGHHPTEIRATLKALKEGLQIRHQLSENGEQKAGRLIVLFQPHRYTRTKDLIDDFSGAFSDADMLVVLDIYPAGEQPIEGVTAETLLDKIRKTGHEHALYKKDRGEATQHIIAEVQKGDIALTLGAGNVWKAGDTILETLRAQEKT